MKKEKKGRRTGSQLQARNAEKVRRRKQEEKAFAVSIQAGWKDGTKLPFEGNTCVVYMLATSLCVSI